MVGETGAGKSNIARLILPQVLALGAKVCIGDPKWTPLDTGTSGEPEDWRPIARRLHLPPARKADDIRHLITFFREELDRRLDARERGEAPPYPLFLYLDEFTTITTDVEGAAEDVARIARLGRGVWIYLLMAAHNLLVKNGAGDTRDQIRTGYYMGGSTTTGAVLLDVSQREVKEFDRELGDKGMAVLRSAATRPPQLVRVPHATNEYVYGLLGDGSDDLVDFAATSRGRSPEPPMKSGRSQCEVGPHATSGASVSLEAVRALVMFRSGMNVPQIALAMNLTKSTSGGAAQKANEQVQMWIREALEGERA
jgi:hypothetical protein